MVSLYPLSLGGMTDDDRMTSPRRTGREMQYALVTEDGAVMTGWRVCRIVRTGGMRQD
ncbi:hypothetical protein VPHK227_0052 [Vibrio phage K227]